MTLMIVNCDIDEEVCDNDDIGNCDEDDDEVDKDKLKKQDVDDGSLNPINNSREHLVLISELPQI